MFQFHIGAIRRTRPSCILSSQTGFNSILVQLEVSDDNGNLLFPDVSIPYWCN